MKKPLIITGVVFIAAVLGAALFFVLNGGNEKSTESISLTGTWLLYQHGEYLPRDEYLVFNESDVSYYRGGESEPAVQSSYVIRDDSLDTPNIDKTFHIQVISENSIVLTEPNTVVWRLLLVGDKDSDRSALIPSDLVGVYDVKVVGEEKRSGETITFTDSHMSLVQGGAETLSSDYLFTEDGILHLTTIDRYFNVYKNGDNLLFVGVGDINVWELYKTK